MNTVTYADMAARHGSDQTDALLKTMEQIAHISEEATDSDHEERFQRAFEVLCATDFLE